MCFVGDAGLDDQKVFHQMELVQADFVVRASHQRTVQVSNQRLDRWEEELLDDSTASLPLPLKFRVAVTHARKVRQADIELGWLRLRLPDTHQLLGALLAHDLVRLTNIPIRTATEAQTVYTQWRYRPRIEHTYRFDQEEGLDVEDIRVQTLERMRRLFALVLLAVRFVYHVAHTWPGHTVLWLRRLGGKLGLSSDLDGPYVLLPGIGAVFLAAATLAFAAHYPFPRTGGICG